MDSNLALIKGADVLLVFVESYGAVSYERPALARGIGPSRREFARAVHETEQQVHLVLEFIERGYLEQLLLSHDCCFQKNDEASMSTSMRSRMAGKCRPALSGASSPRNCALSGRGP